MKSLPESLESAIEMLASGAVTSEQLTRAYLHQISQFDEQLKAFITITPDEAIAAAKKSDLRRAAGKTLSVLDGIPYSLKDNIQSVGVPTSSGTAIWRDFTPENDATVARKLSDSGAVLLGKTNLHELAWGGTTENVYHGTTKNPWDLSRGSAGSSGGSAASVAASMCAFSIGTDTGGSVRGPAAVTGVSGLRPTFGGVSNAGITPLAPTMDTVGPIARTVKDLAIVMQIISGKDSADPHSIELEADWLGKLNSKVNFEGCTVGVPLEYVQQGLGAAAFAVYEANIKEMQDLGAQIVHFEMPFDEVLQDAWALIHTAEPSAYHGALVKTHGAELDSGVRDLLTAGATISAVDYINAQELRQQLVLKFAEIEKSHSLDIIALPGFGGVAPTVGVSTPSEAARAVLEMGGKNRVFTALASLLSRPSISVPSGIIGGLPIGLQLMGKLGRDDDLLSYANAYQSNTEWHKMKAPLTAE